MDLLQILIDQKEELGSVDTSMLCPRNEESEIELQSKLAQVVIGVRRSGKSTLCQKVLLESGVNFAYVNFDDERLSDITADSLDDVLQCLYRINGDFSHLFLDEVQNVAKWPLFVNRLLRQGIKIILTGSNANLLSGELATHLTGRYHQIELFPFSFSEYCSITKTDTESASTKHRALRQHALDTYLQQGGFPELLEINSHNDYAASLLNAIVNKDICRRYNVRYKDALWKLTNLVLDLFAQEVSSNELATQLELKSVHTVESYLSYLINAYLLLPVYRYSYKSKERRPRRKFYAVDMLFISHHAASLQTDNLGWRLENIVAIELYRCINRESGSLYYIRQNASFEVDFVVTDRTHVVELIQVTYAFTNPTVRQYNREVGGLLKGSALTHCDNLTLIVMEGETKTFTAADKTIHQYLATDWLLKSANY
jgi:hypothetical protein